MIIDTKDSLKGRIRKENDAYRIQAKIKQISNSYESIYASLVLPFDQTALRNIVLLAKAKQRLNPYAIIVIGIGGSNLGTLALHEALNGKLYNNFEHPKIFFVDNVDPEYTGQILSLTKDLLRSGKRVILNIVSKSGTTTEIIANTELFLDVMKRYDRLYREAVVVTTDKDSSLWDFADREGFQRIMIPTLVGGRYSVFSTAIFPLSFTNINMKNLFKGASKAVKDCINYKNSPAVKGALALYTNYVDGKIINDLFIFSTDLEYLGKWNRQLVAESLGKRHDSSGKECNIGITPTVSIGSTDLHSMAQLYLAGPRDKVITFISLKEVKEDLIVPNNYKLLPSLEKKKLSKIMDAILKGSMHAFREDKRPLIHIILKNKSEEEIGYFMQYKMIETMILGNLLNVNPFDQPNVEDYKKETRRILESQQR